MYLSLPNEQLLDPRQLLGHRQLLDHQQLVSRQTQDPHGPTVSSALYCTQQCCARMA